MKNLRLSSPLLRWKFVDIGASEVGAVKTPPYVDYDSSLVYYGTDKGWLYVLDVTDGSKVASLDVTGSRDVGLLGSYNGILNYNGNLYMTDTAGFLHVVSKISGISRQATLNENSVKIKDNRMISSPVLDDVNNLLYIGTEDGEIYKVSINSQGTMSDPVSVYHADGEIFIGTPYIDDNYLYFAGCQKLYKFDKRTFSLSDSVDLDLSVQSKCVSSALSKVNGLILVAANDGVLYAYSADTLSLYWKFTPSQGVLANRLNLNLEPMRSMPVEAVNVDGMVFVGNDNGRAYSVDLKLGEALGEHIVRGDVHTLNSFEFMGSSKVIFGAETGIYVMDVENCMATDDICTSDVHCNVGEICLNGACEDVTYEVTGFGESCVRDSLGVAVDINNYDSMKNSFICARSGLDQSPLRQGLYRCSGLLNDIKKGKNNFYFRCKDQPQKTEGRNVNKESYQFSLIRTEKLGITSIEPKDKVFRTNPKIIVKTALGAENGVSFCGYSNERNAELSSIPQFAKTNSSTHEQQLRNLRKGRYTFYVTCVDVAGNTAKDSASFEVAADVSQNVISNVYKDTRNNILIIGTNEDSTCYYDNKQFNFGEGIPMTDANSKKHEAVLPVRSYFVLCKDAFNNEESITVYP